MSYILDALRRAERERQPAQPELRIVTDGSGTRIAGPQPPPWPWIAGGIAAAFALGVGLTGLLRPAPESAAPSPAAALPAATAAANTANTAAAASPPARPVEAVTRPRVTAPVPQPISAARSLDDLVDPEAGLAEDPPEPELLPPPEAMAEPVFAESPLDEPEAPAQTRVQQYELQPAPKPGAVELKDLPPEVRADFPRLALDVHFYEDDPARRFVMINGRRYREGDTLGEGPQLLEIAPDSLTLDHRGQRVLIPVTH